LAGLVLGFVYGWDKTGLGACAAMFAAGASLYRMNVLFRVGVAGDRDRDEDAARRVFDEHGRWPDDRRQRSRRSR
jgi:hypothetical protein